MKYNLEIQSHGFDINSDSIVKFVKESLKNKKVTLSKIKDLNIYYVTDTKIIYYTGMYEDDEVAGTIYVD